MRVLLSAVLGQRTLVRPLMKSQDVVVWLKLVRLEDERGALGSSLPDRSQDGRRPPILFAELEAALGISKTEVGRLNQGRSIASGLAIKDRKDGPSRAKPAAATRVHCSRPEIFVFPAKRGPMQRGLPTAPSRLLFAIPCTAPAVSSAYGPMLMVRNWASRSSRYSKASRKLRRKTSVSTPICL